MFSIVYSLILYIKFTVLIQNNIHICCNFKSILKQTFSYFGNITVTVHVRHSLPHPFSKFFPEHQIHNYAMSKYFFSCIFIYYHKIISLIFIISSAFKPEFHAKDLLISTCFSTVGKVADLI